MHYIRNRGGPDIGGGAGNLFDASILVFPEYVPSGAGACPRPSHMDRWYPVRIRAKQRQLHHTPTREQHITGRSRPGICLEGAAALRKPLIFGQTGTGAHRIPDIPCETVRGPKLHGVGWPGGAGREIARADRIGGIRARYSAAADDGALIRVGAPGAGEAPPAVIPRVTVCSRRSLGILFPHNAATGNCVGNVAWMGQRLLACKGIGHPGGVRLRCSAGP